ncbi:putative DNA-binding protein [Trabulsiella guamensis ATCC 49490]|uniref:Putative DNA-binding protein n=1 Tax=Trabulsiella guamensis ATCC 49490 TaxID=1005994 RepID=A0A084ZNV1_9ENTR|nr:transcriptional regulator [Trabulsiella guamensis]KFB99145.1 putative DNA-binding protein [Trabulsiella guamensis ATCC 49490]
MDMIRIDIALRLVEERTRLGYSQANFAKQLNVSREGLRLYETGQRGISAEFLAGAAALGIDVQYVLTGIESENRKTVTAALQPSVNVSSQGTANVVQFAQLGSTINMVSTQKHVTNTKAEVKAGTEHISESQAAKLTKLVKYIVELESRVKKKPSSFRGVWASLNEYCGVTRYRLIPFTSYEKAETFLNRWIGRLNAQPMAAISDNIEWRKRRYAYIKINTKDDEKWLESYLRKNFQVTSLTDLSDDELTKVYRAVTGKKRRVKRN